MSFEFHYELLNFATKFGIFWQRFCEIDCNSKLFIQIGFEQAGCNFFNQMHPRPQGLAGARDPLKALE